MEMTSGEIIRSYNGAKNKRQQVSILADLNGCSKDEIVAIIAADSRKNDADNVSSGTNKDMEADKMINWLYDQLDATEGQIRALEARYKELSVALKVAGEYSEAVEHDLRNTESK